MTGPVVSGSGVFDPGVSDPGVSDPGVTDLGVTDLGVSDPGVTDRPENDATATPTGAPEAAARTWGSAERPVELDPERASGGSDATSSASTGRPTHRGVTWLFAAAAFVTAVGVLVAGFAVYLFAFTPLQEARAQDRLLASFHGLGALAALTGRVPPEGKPVALLEIPALHLRQVVVEGTTASDLMSGPGLMEGSALPGLTGNTVIAGRRILYGKPFGAIDALPRGALVVVIGAFGRFDYRVVSRSLIEPGQPDPVVPTSDARLTLLTSDGTLAPTGREAVVASMTSRPADVDVVASSVPPSSQRALSGDWGALSGVLLWGEAFVFGVIAVAVAYRRWRHPWPTYLMTTPVLVALAFLFFNDFARLLPATL